MVALDDAHVGFINLASYRLAYDKRSTFDETYEYLTKYVLMHLREFLEDQFEPYKDDEPVKQSLSVPARMKSYVPSLDAEVDFPYHRLTEEDFDFAGEDRREIDDYKIPLLSAIIILNDDYGWSRQRIADWLETLDVDLQVRFKEMS